MKETSALHSCQQTCSTCGATGELIPFAHYERYLIELKDNQPVVYSLNVPRYRCLSCGHTHALMSSCLIPYRSYSLRFILHLLRSYFLKRKTVTQLCFASRTSPSTLYSWKELFLKHKQLWLGILEALLTESHTFLSNIDGKFLNTFHQWFRFSFLERLPGTDWEAPVGGRRSPPAFTP